MRKRVLIVAAMIALAVVLAFALDNRMVVRHYELEAEEVTSPVRIVLVTDLHSCYYGEGQKDLIAAIDAQAPDVILLGGDIFDDKKVDANTERFLAGIAGRYAAYYVTGNHEYRVSAEDFAAKMSILEKYGVTVLSGACKTVEVNGETINICGTEDPEVYKIKYDKEKDPAGYETARKERYTTFDKQLDAIKAQVREEYFTILLSHRPELFENYVSRGFDLVLCGHAHGGQWRIPGLLNGLFAPNQGLFPKYAGGEYRSGGTTMIVSRGLARETTIVPRIFNPPELVVITVK